jgi:ribonucleotide monophosphatase NagD (HAD superfamily)
MPAVKQASRAVTRALHSASSPVASSSKLPSFVFDIDGVLLQGKKVLDEGREALRILSGHNRLNLKFPYLLLTNGGGVLEETRAQKLTQQLGVSVRASYFKPAMPERRSRSRLET